MSPRNTASAARKATADEKRAADDIANPTVTPAAPRPRIATDYIHTQHPDTGLDVVFVPGEALPAWANPADPEE